MITLNSSEFTKWSWQVIDQKMMCSIYPKKKYAGPMLSKVFNCLTYVHVYVCQHTLFVGSSLLSSNFSFWQTYYAQNCAQIYICEIWILAEVSKRDCSIRIMELYLTALLEYVTALLEYLNFSTVIIAALQCPALKVWQQHVLQPFELVLLHCTRRICVNYSWS